ncbi:MAG: type IV toxin-antitoxin system AbiEi family antitoxin domain-containing protein [Endomicrobium sp.]|jgi:predicted transcriptional regulator of viral defense system|nr:type IV toxin-antitoxin system AbiEi family antitoxin domain-containing protein [Endomicrobium sp.]
MKQRILDISKKHSGIITTSDFEKANINRYQKEKWIESGELEKVKYGVYALPNTDETIIIFYLFYGNIICAETALFYYNYSDRVPPAWDIAVVRGTSKTKFNVDYPHVNAHYISKEHLTYGLDKIKIHGVEFTIFDRDRLIVELIKNENNTDKETFNKAIQKYLNDEKKNIQNLLEYARKRNNIKKVRDRLGIWL